jgi:hypothetical protein
LKALVGLSALTSMFVMYHLLTAAFHNRFHLFDEILMMNVSRMLLHELIVNRYFVIVYRHEMIRSPVIIPVNEQLLSDRFR